MGTLSQTLMLTRCSECSLEILSLEMVHTSYVYFWGMWGHCTHNLYAMIMCMCVSSALPCTSIGLLQALGHRILSIEIRLVGQCTDEEQVTAEQVTAMG